MARCMVAYAGPSQDDYCARGRHVAVKVMGRWVCSNCGTVVRLP